ncbi:MAG: hypothetical protein AAGA80_16435 [Cyanobacteria bacterium P01_F01_bin.143]
MPEQIVDYLAIIFPISLFVMVAIIFFNKSNQKAEFEIKIPNKFELTIKTTKKDIET